MSQERTIKIIECPRDAMQGYAVNIPSAQKIKYLNSLLKVGYEMLDCGSFVSPRLIPQMADTKEVLDEIDLNGTNTKISVITASESGVERALKHRNVHVLGFPFSVSEKFQQYNTNKSRETAFELLRKVSPVIEDEKKEIWVYFSMAFGNPYQEEWNGELVAEWVRRFDEIGINKINISDTIGIANKETIEVLFGKLIPEFPHIDFGAHFHTTYKGWHEKVHTAYENGCRRFDGAIKGYGGCPMSKSDLVGNMPTEKLISYAVANKLEHNLNLFNFESAYNKCIATFG